MSKSGIRVAFVSSFLFAALASAQIAHAQVARAPGNAWGQGDAIVRLKADGSGSVNLRNGCIVSYNWFGTRISATPRCNAAMRAYSDRVFRDQQWRRG